MGERGGQGSPEQAAPEASSALQVMNPPRDRLQHSPQHRHKGKCIAFTVGGLKSMDEARLRADGMEKLRPEKRS